MSKSIMIPVLALALGVGLNNAAHAATLGDVAAAIAAPSGSAQPTNDWTSFSTLKGAKWKGGAPAKGGNKYYWNGKMPIDGVGTGEVSLVGSQNWCSRPPSTGRRTSCSPRCPSC